MTSTTILEVARLRELLSGPEPPALGSGRISAGQIWLTRSASRPRPSSNGKPIGACQGLRWLSGTRPSCTSWSAFRTHQRRLRWAYDVRLRLSHRMLAIQGGKAAVRQDDHLRKSREGAWQRPLHNDR